MRKIVRSISLGLVMVLGMAGSAASATQGGSIGQGDFTVVKGGQSIDKLSGQNPIQDESMLVCDGKCMVKSEGVSLVAADQAKFAIKNENDTFRLFLREGTVDYVFTDKARKVAFHTPEGVYSVAEILFTAGGDPVVRGSVRVTAEGKTEISVKEGKLVFASADGMKAIGADEKIVLAISSPPAPAGPPPPLPDGSNISPFVVAGAGAALLATVIVIANNNDDDDDNQVPDTGTETETQTDRTPSRRTPTASPSN